MTTTHRKGALISPHQLASLIFELRGEKVMLDRDLAKLYGVTTKNLNRAVARNRERFPPDFMFQLDEEEAKLLRSQIVTSKEGRGGRRYRPYAFTEQGVAMLSSVLRSARAVDVNIEIMRAFVRLRHWAVSNAELGRRIDELEKKYDGQFTAIFDALRQLMAPPADDTPREMGYHTLVSRPGNKSATSRRRK
jgi:hypothetical protein